MTGPARQSYYEIALTSRQVMTVFVVLLVAILASFLSGVWVGRQGSAPKVETVEAQAIEAVGEEEDAPLERLDFFSRDATDAAPAGSDAETVAEPGTAPPVELARVSPPAEEPTPEDSADAAEAESTAAPDQPEPATEAEPAPVAPAPEPAASERVAAAPADGAGTLVVQVFSSSNQVQAQSVVDQLRAGGYPALLSPVEVSGRTMYRVRIGPYGDRRVAEGVAEQVRNRFRLETWITE